MFETPSHVTISVPAVQLGHMAVPTPCICQQPAQFSEVGGGPYIQFQIMNSAHLGYPIIYADTPSLSHSAKRFTPMCEKQLERLMTKSPDDFEALARLAHLSQYIINNSQKKKHGSTDPVSMALREALRRIARRAREDLDFLSSFRAWCHDRQRRPELYRIFLELQDGALADPGSAEYFLLDALAGFDIDDARICYTDVLFAIKRGLSPKQANWREFVQLAYLSESLESDTHSIGVAKVAKAIPRARRRVLAIAAQVVDEGKAREIQQFLEIDVEQNIDLMVNDPEAWIATIEEIVQSTMSALSKMEGEISSYEPWLFIKACIQEITEKADILSLKRGITCLAGVALSNFKAFVLLAEFSDASHEEVATSAFNHIERFDSDRMKSLVERDPVMLLQLMVHLATITGIDNCKEALRTLDAETLEQELNREGFEIEPVLPLLAELGNKQAKRELDLRQGRDPDAGQKVIPFKHPDGKK